MTKKKILLNLEAAQFEALENKAKELGISKTEYIRSLIRQDLAGETKERLSKHIARDIEAMELIFLLNNMDLVEKIDEKKLMENIEKIYEKIRLINKVKGLYLKDYRAKKDKELKDFWNKILTLLEPKNFVNEVAVNGKLDIDKTKNFIAKLYQIVKENKKLWS